MTTNYYALLKVKQNATPEEIDEAYDKLYTKYNSDEMVKNCSYIEYAMDRALEWMEIEKAYATLSNVVGRTKRKNRNRPRVTYLCYRYHEGLIDKIKSNKKHGKLALEMLNVMAYLNPKDIPLVIFLGLTNSDAKPLLSCLDLLEPCGLIHWKKEQEQLLLRVHKITQHNIQLMLRDEDMDEEVFNKAVDLLESIIWSAVPHKLMKSKGIKSETRGVPKIELFYPHVEHILNDIDGDNEKCKKMKRIIEGFTRADHLNETKNLPYKLMFTDEGFSDP